MCYGSIYLGEALFEVLYLQPGCLCAQLPPCSDKDLANVAAVSAGNNADIGKLISDAMAKVGAVH